jgi:hypothetical protein
MCRRKNQHKDARLAIVDEKEIPIIKKLLYF